MTSYLTHIPFSRRRQSHDGPTRPARRITLDVRRRPERHHSPW